MDCEGAVIWAESAWGNCLEEQYPKPTLALLPHASERARRQDKTLTIRNSTNKRSTIPSTQQPATSPEIPNAARIPTNTLSPTSALLVPSRARRVVSCP